MATKDLFEALKEAVGCMYISDLCYTPYREQAIRKAKRMELSAYGEPQIDDLCNYLSIDRATLDLTV